MRFVLGLLKFVGSLVLYTAGLYFLIVLLPPLLGLHQPGWLVASSLETMLFVVLLTIVSFRRQAALGLPVATLMLLMFLGNWSVAYHYLSRDENCFGQRLNATDVMYFTMTTLTTTGYGDIKPRSALCRRFVTLQMIEDLILTGSVLAIVGDAIISVTRRREDVAKSSH